MTAKDTDTFVLSKGGMARLVADEYAREFGTGQDEAEAAAKRLEALLEAKMQGHEAPHA